MVVPSAADILTMTEEDLEVVNEAKVYEAKSHKEGDSEFTAYFQRVSNEVNVQNGYTKMKLKFGDATHIAAAYRLEDARGPYNQAFMDDSEPGAGRNILDTIKSMDAENVAIYVVRYSGGGKLGGRRFEIYKSLAKSAIKALRVKLEKLSRNNRMSHSNSQLSQSSITSVLEEDQYTSAESEIQVDAQMVNQVQHGQDHDQAS